MDLIQTLPPAEARHELAASLPEPVPALEIDGCDTIVKLFQARCEALGDRAAHREKRGDRWLPASWRAYHKQARLIGLGLVALGLRRGQVVSILADNRKEWIQTDVGVQCVGGICSGIYTTDSASQLRYLLVDSDSRFLFVDNQTQLDKFLTIGADVPAVVKVIVFESDAARGVDDPRVIDLEALIDVGRAFQQANDCFFEREVARSRPQDTAVLVYTSGTTGPPKGAMLSHGNIIASMLGAGQVVPVRAEDEQICFLPLCHILERCNSIFGPIAMKSTVSFAQSPRQVLDNLVEVSPHVLSAAPRIWEKAYGRVALQVQAASPLRRWCIERAVETGQRRIDALESTQRVSIGLRLRHALADRFVLRPLRRDLGFARLRYGLSGAAPIAPELLRWYQAIGLDILEAYGMTETSGIASGNLMHRRRTGSVGPVVPGGELRIAADGEIQYRGPKVFKGYWNQPEKTAETMTPDGWLKTGDIGRVDGDGFLYITGRLKDIIITAGGKNITPAEIENRLKFSAYISDAMVIGDRRPYLTCLVVIDPETVGRFARERGIKADSYRELCAAQDVHDMVEGVIEETNREFARVEQIKAFRLLDVLFMPGDEEVTATMKLKRRFVEKKYKALIDEMYDQG
ncbi:AMP-dependent synthetase/ligase [soil metagenome]